MQDGGAEKVLQVLMRMYPDAPIYTLMYDQDIINKYYKNKKIETSIIQRIPGGRKFYRWFMPIMPMAIEFFDLRSFNIVISDSSSFAKGVITDPDTLHVCYCHTPTRYLWSDTHQYINDLNYNKYFKKIISLSLNFIRLWDKAAADRVDVFIANSQTSKNRIRKYYRRDSTIIYPSIEEEKFNISENIQDYYLAGCRLVPYKKIDLVIEAFKELDKPLKIFGDGLDLPRLQAIAGGNKNIEFLGRVSDRERAKLYSECKAYINPQKEDFGITIVEAMASGRPVIAYGKGGATETVEDKKTGLFYYENTIEGLKNAVNRLENLDFDPKYIREHALEFSTKNFEKRIDGFIKSEYKKFREFNTINHEDRHRYQDIDGSAA